MNRKSVGAIVAGLFFIIGVRAIPQCWAGGKIYEMQAGTR